MAKRKVKVWSNPADKSVFTLWAPFPYEVNGIKVGRLTVFDTENDDWVAPSDMDVNNPERCKDYFAYWLEIPGPNEFNLGKTWHFVKVEGEYLIYTSEENLTKLREQGIVK